jgi:hypothetical protein
MAPVKSSMLYIEREIYFSERQAIATKILLLGAAKEWENLLRTRPISRKEGPRGHHCRGIAAVLGCCLLRRGLLLHH